MNNKSATLFSTAFLIIASSLISACDYTKNKPVSLGGGLILSDLLSSHVEIRNVDELSKLINEPWYSEVEVEVKDGSKVTLYSCSDYFSFGNPDARTVKEYEMDAYLELKTMCEASRVMLSAKTSKLSYLPTPILNDSSPDLLPKELSFTISSSESNRIEQNEDIRYWSDVTPITDFKINSDSKFTYYNIGGYQEVDIIGRGDINNDEVEDLIVVIRDYVLSGSYFNMRVLALSVDSNECWSLVSEY